MLLEEPGELSNLVVGVEVLQDFTSDSLPGLRSLQGSARKTTNVSCSARLSGLTMVELPTIPKAAKCRERSCQGSEQQAEDPAEGQGQHGPVLLTSMIVSSSKTVSKSCSVG